MRFKGGREFLLFFVLAHLIESKEMVWKYDADISNPDNWIGGKVALDCKGIHFAPVNDAPIDVGELKTAEITLPVDGEIVFFNGSRVEFEDHHICIKLKPINYHDWFDYDSWVHSSDNPATPHKERIPCEHDVAVFPAGSHTRIKSIVPIVISDIKIKNFEGSISDPKFAQMTYNPMGRFTMRTTKESCNDPFGCFCHRTYVPCPAKLHEEATCRDPIEPEDFCHGICGAYVTFAPQIGFELGKFRERLGKYSVATHASRVKDYLGNDLIQVVFTEKSFSGKSVSEAEEFFNQLKSSEGAHLKNSKIFKSGAYYYVEGASPALGIVFGTLVAVAAFFGLLFYLNGEEGRVGVVMDRIRLNRARGSLFTMPFFARFDNTDENLIIEGQSVSGSVLDLPKSFDNPMFGREGSSTESESQHSNPLYEVALKKEREEQDDDVNHVNEE